MPICQKCRTAYLDSETHVCDDTANDQTSPAFKAISGVAVYLGSLYASVTAVNAYFHYHDEAAGGLAFIVVVNVATLGALLWIPLLAYLSRLQGFAGFAVVWTAAAATGFLQVLLLTRFYGL